MTSRRKTNADACHRALAMLAVIVLVAPLAGRARQEVRVAPARQAAPTDTARIARMLAHVKTLAADDMEGRAPGTPGETRAVAYLIAELKALGLEPGNPDGSYVQAVPLIAFTGKPTASFVTNGRRTDLASPDDYVAVSRQGLAQVAVADSDLVFVGHGVVAPEFGWDDYKGIDVRGKTLIMLIGDPPVADAKTPSALDATMFKGAAMTYYGRWTYKFEIAAEKGAAAAIIVHETGPAGYPFDVVQRWAGENYGEASGNLVASHAAVDSWIALDRAKELFAANGLDFATLKARAATRTFRPVALGTKASFTVKNTIRAVSSQNVLAKLTGSDPALRGECVIYSAHWDYFGRNASLQGDQIFNGALDNGSGMAELLAIAERFTQMSPRPRRSMLFLLPTAEEAGLLGAKHYANNPLWPLERTLAVINMDIMNFWGRARGMVSVGHGMTTLDELLVAEAAKQDRIVLPDPEGEKGYFYRSDHFPLVKEGVPALHFLHPGAEYRDQPADYGTRMRDRYTTNDYHKVTDDVKPDWDLRGALEDVDLLTAVGRLVANGDVYPEWKPGTEFKARRDGALKAYREKMGPRPTYTR